MTGSGADDNPKNKTSFLSFLFEWYLYKKGLPTFIISRNKRQQQNNVIGIYMAFVQFAINGVCVYLYLLFPIKKCRL